MPSSWRRFCLATRSPNVGVIAEQFVLPCRALCRNGSRGGDGRDLREEPEAERHVQNGNQHWANSQPDGMRAVHERRTYELRAIC